jgi:hypothetical protein
VPKDVANHDKRCPDTSSVCASGDSILKYSGRPGNSRYITQRCEKLSGRTVREALTSFRFVDEKGRRRAYAMSDLRYDLSSKRLTLDSKTLAVTPRRSARPSLASTEAKAQMSSKKRSETPPPVPRLTRRLKRKQSLAVVTKKPAAQRRLPQQSSSSRLRRGLARSNIAG